MPHTVDFTTNVIIAIDPSDILYLGTGLDNERGTLDFQVLDDDNAIAILQPVAVSIHDIQAPSFASIDGCFELMAELTPKG